MTSPTPIGPGPATGASTGPTSGPRKAVDAFDPWSPSFVVDPYPAYDVLRGAGRALWFERSDQWLIPHYADVSALLRDRRLGRTYLHRFTHEEFGRQAPPPEYEPFTVLNGEGMLDLEDPAHGRIRRLVAKAFTPRMVEDVVPTVRRLAAEMAGSLYADGGGDLLARLAEPLPVAVIAEMLGIPPADRNLLRPWSAAICGMYELNPPPETAARAVRASEEFSAYLGELIAARRRDPGTDLISALIAAHDGGDVLTEQEMVSTVVLLLNAGHEATVNTTTLGWLALFHHPEQMRTLYERPGLLPGAIEEMLRYDTPLQLFERWVLDDIEVGGTVIPRGCEVALLFGSANHDPARFTDSHRFDITRPAADNKHVSFGAGIHYCLGAPLARVELAASFGTLLRDAPGMRLAAEPPWRDGYVIRGPRELLVTW
jgi:cytochrome P450